MVNLNILIPFYQKQLHKKLISCLICNLTYLQDSKTKVKFKLRILEKILVGSETNFKVGSGFGYRSKKSHSGSNTGCRYGLIHNFLGRLIPDLIFKIIFGEILV
jgi:hypothetical protein